MKVVLLGRYNAQGLDNDYELLIRVDEGSEATSVDFYMFFYSVITIHLTCCHSGHCTCTSVMRENQY